MRVLTISAHPHPRSFCRRRVAPIKRCRDERDEQLSFAVVRRAR
jgi:hypothetical protein